MNGIGFGTVEEHVSNVGDLIDSISHKGPKFHFANILENKAPFVSGGKRFLGKHFPWKIFSGVWVQQKRKVNGKLFPK